MCLECQRSREQCSMSLLQKICSLCVNTGFYFEIGLSNSDIQAQPPEPDTPEQSLIPCTLGIISGITAISLTSSTGDSAKQTGTHWSSLLVSPAERNQCDALRSTSQPSLKPLHLWEGLGFQWSSQLKSESFRFKLFSGTACLTIIKKYYSFFLLWFPSVCDKTIITSWTGQHGSERLLNYSFTSFKHFS